MGGASETVTIAGCLDVIKGCATTCLEFITDNAILMTIFAGGIMASLAFRFIRKAKKAAK